MVVPVVSGLILGASRLLEYRCGVWELGFSDRVFFAVRHVFVHSLRTLCCI